MYFMPEIRSRSTEIVYFYNCDGKQNLKNIRLDTYRIADELGRCLFFADRDYDDFTDTQISDDEQTYITDFYSIENHLATTEAADILLSDIAGMPRSQPDFQAVMRSLVESRRAFFSALRPIVAWVICARIDELKINLNNADLSKVLNRSSAGKYIRKGNGFAYFRKQVGAEHYRPRSGLYKAVWYAMDCCDDKLWMRGKYELWFFRFEMRSLITGLMMKKTPHGRKIKLPQALANNSMFELLSARVSKPQSVVEFLNNRLGAPR